MNSIAALPAIWNPPAQTQIHRTLIAAFARPGSVQDLSPWLDGAMAHVGVLATLVDSATTFCDPWEILAKQDRTLLGAIPAALDNAAFVLVSGEKPVPAGFRIHTGTLLAPERGATLCLTVQDFCGGTTLDLSGPGIDGRTALRIHGLDYSWLSLRAELIAFPCGIDVIYCSPTQIAAVPRSTRVTWEA